MKHDDIHIIKEVLGGKSEQFEHILNRYSEYVFNLIAHIVPCKEDAEELTQDVFIKAFRQLSSFKEESCFSTWIYRIATNTALSAARKRKHNTLHLDDAAYSNIHDEIIDEALDNDSEEQLQRLSSGLATPFVQLCTEVFPYCYFAVIFFAFLLLDHWMRKYYFKHKKEHGPESSI